MNIVIDSQRWLASDIPTLFGDESFFLVPCPDCLSQLMVYLKIYPSTSKARQAGRVGPIPLGWTVFKASKKQTLWIWNPSE